MLSSIMDTQNLEIIKDDFITFENSLEFEDERGFLYDDMFLAKSKISGILLDIGWVNGSDDFNNGYFRLSIISDENWESPILNLIAKDKQSFTSELNAALVFLRNYENAINTDL